MLLTCKIEFGLREIKQLEGEPDWKFEERCDLIADTIAAMLEEGDNEVERTTLKFGKIY